MFWNGKTAIDGLSGSGKGAWASGAEVVPGPTRYARIGQSLEPCRDINPVAKDVAILDHDVALMDADAQLDAAVCWIVTVPVGDLPLDFDGAAQRVDDTAELYEKPVAGRLDPPAARDGERRLNHLRPDRLQPAECSFLVRADQPRIAGDIGSQDRGEPPLGAVLPSSVH